MKNIIVAGAGHGGLTAAANLAKNGFDVTVIESQDRKDMGHDWSDTMCLDAFEKTGFPTPDKSDYTPHYKACYHNPSKDVRMVSPKEPEENVVVIDRKFLVNFLIVECEKQGVKFIFNTKITSVITKNTCVTGIKTENGDFYGDLIIDAAGIDSPVRRNLPEEFGIQNEIDKNEYFMAYRAFYEKTDNTVKFPPYNIYFFHCNRAGMDWAITENSYIDILAGSFGDLSEAEAMEAAKDFSKEYPNMGEKILRGGQITKIPLRRTLPMIVANGYAAVGDSAVMVEPLSGSGITLSMLAGKILADTIKKYRNASKETLWQYQYEYFKQLEEDRLSTDIIKNCLSAFSAEQIDYLFQSKILTEYEIAGGGMPDYTAKELLMKGVSMIKHPEIIPNFAKMLVGMANIKNVCAMMPKKYDEKKIKAWAKKYEKL